MSEIFVEFIENFLLDFEKQSPRVKEITKNVHETLDVLMVEHGFYKTLSSKLNYIVLELFSMLSKSDRQDYINNFEIKDKDDIEIKKIFETANRVFNED